MLSWLTYKILAYVAGGLALLAAGLAVALWAQGVQVGRLENQRDKAQNEVAQARVSIKGFQDAVKQCNEGVAKLKADSVQKQAESDQNLARVRAETKKHQPANQRRAAILASPTPKGATCATALTEIRKELRP